MSARTGAGTSDANCISAMRRWVRQSIPNAASRHENAAKSFRRGRPSSIAPNTSSDEIFKSSNRTLCDVVSVIQIRERSRIDDVAEGGADLTGSHLHGKLAQPHGQLARCRVEPTN